LPSKGVIKRVSEKTWTYTSGNDPLTFEVTVKKE
jgi:hypothetical protein